MFSKLFGFLRGFDAKHRDPRIDRYGLLCNGYFIVGMVLVYYAFVKHIGPKYMDSRPPFKLRYPILLYNFVQVVCNAYLSISVGKSLVTLWAYESISCMEPYLDNSLVGTLELRYCVYYLALKKLDLLDTVFFVLRKRYHQVSFLHVYHHMMILLSTYIFVRYFAGGQGGSLGLLNSFVHIFMYSYYLLSALSSTIKESLWWKRYITQAQIIQFVILSIHYLMNLANSSCGYPKLLTVFCLFQSVFMTVLFSEFYYKSYLRSSPAAKKAVDTKLE